MSKLDMEIFVELLNYWLNDLTDTSNKIGYMQSSYEVSGIESVVSGIQPLEDRVEILRGKIGRTMTMIYEGYKADE